MLDVGRQHGEWDVDVGEESAVLLLGPPDLALAGLGAVDLAERRVLMRRKVISTLNKSSFLLSSWNAKFNSCLNSTFTIKHCQKHCWTKWFKTNQDRRTVASDVWHLKAGLDDVGHRRPHHVLASEMFKNIWLIFCKKIKCTLIYSLKRN